MERVVACVEAHPPSFDDNWYVAELGNVTAHSSGAITSALRASVPSVVVVTTSNKSSHLCFPHPSPLSPFGLAIDVTKVFEADSKALFCMSSGPLSQPAYCTEAGPLPVAAQLILRSAAAAGLGLVAVPLRAISSSDEAAGMMEWLVGTPAGPITQTVALRAADADRDAEGGIAIVDVAAQRWWKVDREALGANLAVTAPVSDSYSGGAAGLVEDEAVEKSLWGCKRQASAIRGEASRTLGGVGWGAGVPKGDATGSLAAGDVVFVIGDDAAVAAAVAEGRARSARAWAASGKEAGGDAAATTPTASSAAAAGSGAAAPHPESAVADGAASAGVADFLTSCGLVGDAAAVALLLEVDWGVREARDLAWICGGRGSPKKAKGGGEDVRDGAVAACGGRVDVGGDVNAPIDDVLLEGVVEAAVCGGGSGLTHEVLRKAIQKARDVYGGAVKVE